MKKYQFKNNCAKCNIFPVGQGIRQNLKCFGQKIVFFYQKNCIFFYQKLFKFCSVFWPIAKMWHILHNFFKALGCFSTKQVQNFHFSTWYHKQASFYPILTLIPYFSALFWPCKFFWNLVCLFPGRSCWLQMASKWVFWKLTPFLRVNRQTKFQNFF